MANLFHVKGITQTDPEIRRTAIYIRENVTEILIQNWSKVKTLFGKKLFLRSGRENY